MLAKLPKWALYGSAILAFNAGFVNSTTLVGVTHLAVSHVTGNVTLFAVAMVRGDWGFFVLVCLTLLAFLFGSVVGGYLVGGRSYRLGLRYELALVLEMLLLILALVLLNLGQTWGQIFAAMACGLQNAMVAIYSGMGIRTTHLTGLTTDMGAAIGNWLAGRAIKKFMLVFQAILWYAYCGGAVLGTWVYYQLAYWGLVVPIVIVAMLAMGYRMIVKTTKAIKKQPT